MCETKWVSSIKVCFFNYISWLYTKTQSLAVAAFCCFGMLYSVSYYMLCIFSSVQVCFNVVEIRVNTNRVLHKKLRWWLHSLRGNLTIQACVNLFSLGEQPIVIQGPLFPLTERSLWFSGLLEAQEVCSFEEEPFLCGWCWCTLYGPFRQTHSQAADGQRETD